jgi:hypothetical protein
MTEQSQPERSDFLELGRRLLTVELPPEYPVIHVTPNCGPDYDLVMLNLYVQTRFLTPASARELAATLLAAASATEHNLAEAKANVG